MKITKTQLKQIIKEELEEMRVWDPTQELSAQGLSGDETLYYEPDEDPGAPLTGPPSGAESIADAAYQLGRFFGGKLGERAEVIAQALEKVGAARAAEKLRLGAQSANPA